MPNGNEIEGCQIWHGCPGTGFWNRDANGGGIYIDVEDSPRAGGQYTIAEEARWMVNDDSLDDSHKARLTTMLIDQREIGDRWPKVTTALIEKTKTVPALAIHKRAERLLRCLARNSSELGQDVDTFPHQTDDNPGPTNPTFFQAMAWS